MKRNISITMDQSNSPDPSLNSNLHEKIELIEDIEEPDYNNYPNQTSITIMLQTGDKRVSSITPSQGIEKKGKSGMIMKKAILKVNIFFVKIEIEWGRG
jgi:hypothetical protein